MKKTALLLTLFILAISTVHTAEPASSSLSDPKRIFNHVVLVTYDGARKYWVDALVENGTLTNLASLKKEGAEITLRITDHNPSTDPGMACIESGYGPDITGIDMNYFASSIKPSIPEGLTTTERIKAIYGEDWKTALIIPWTQQSVNVTNTADSTFWNQKKETDYWFSSENVTWSVNNPKLAKNALSFTSALLRANYTASKVAEFIRSNNDSNFYLRVHFVEPDHVGHGYAESVDSRISPKYKQALIECDEALRLIVDALKETGIYNETVILVTTDHGFRGITHGPPTYPFGDPAITETWLIINDPEVTNDLGWGLQNDVSPTCLALAGIDPSELRPYYNVTSRALPLWKASINNREMTPPSISDVSYSVSVREGEVFNITAKIIDKSGISAAQIRYSQGTFWRTVSLQQKNKTLYNGSIGPFVQGTEVTWYLRVADNSTSLNVAYFPENKTTLSFTAKERVAEINPPVITEVRYSEQVFRGAFFTLTVKAQDESGIASVEIYYSSDSDWKRKELTPKGESVYEGSIGPFDSGRQVRWYLNVTDNSANRNMAFHPADKQPLVIKVGEKGILGVPLEFFVVGVALAVVVILVIVYRLKSR